MNVKTHTRLAGATATVLAAALALGGCSSSGGGAPEPGAAPTGPSAGEASQEGQDPARPPRELTITSVGDTVIGRQPSNLPPNPATYFDDVRAELTGDVVITNFEGALSTNLGYRKCGESLSQAPGATGCYYHVMPLEYAELVAGAGFDVANIANNHGYDAGPDGQATTVAALEAAGVVPAGVKDEVAVYDADGVRVAVVGTAAYNFFTNFNDLDAVTALVEDAAAQADVVVFNMHIGAEGLAARHVTPGPEVFVGEARGDAMAVARAAVDAGADLVVGHGPHVLRGMEVYKDRLIAYSLGNFAGWGALAWDGAFGRGAILKVTVNEDGEVVGGQVVPSIMVNGGYPSVDPNNGAYADFNELAADFGANGVTVGADGALVLPGS